METADDDVHIEEMRRGAGTGCRGESCEERARAGAWRKGAVEDGVLGELVRMGDVFSMVLESWSWAKRWAS
jgi:hypothetical protein